MVPSQPYVLVAGIGNLFLGDDGFGVEVAKRLRGQVWPEGVRIADYGIRGLHLVLDILEHRYETTVLVDAEPRGGEPGDVYLIAPDLVGGGEDRDVVPHGPGTSPDSIFALLRRLGGAPGRVLIVGCEPESVDERVGLSPTVDRAIDEAMRLVAAVVKEAMHVSGDSRSDRRPH